MKLGIILISIFAVVSVALVITGIKRHDDDPNLSRLPYSNGLMTKLEFQGHSYVGWSCNCGVGLVHDPDCACQKSNE